MAAREALIHGGDWAGFKSEYGKLPLDFSASISPLGLPESVRKAAADALKMTDRYPDPLCRELRAALTAACGIPEEQIVCGNGASDLIYRICRVLHPRNAAVLTPGFAEYERALCAENSELDLIPLPEANGFRLTEETVQEIPQNCELLFLCNPNNPAGLLAERESVQMLLDRCRETGMCLVADECFLDFVERPEDHSLIPALRNTPDLVVLRAFTKTWAMAGLRLGYALCGNGLLARALRDDGPPWAVSGVAQAAGLAALREQAYVQTLREAISGERKRMLPALEAMGLRVIPGEANFLLFRSADPELADKLRRRGILIRDCRNFRGLCAGWYRVAVRAPEENDRLLSALREEL